MTIVYSRPPKRSRTKPATTALQLPRIVEALPPKKLAAAKSHQRRIEAMREPPDPEVQAFMARMVRPPGG